MIRPEDVGFHTPSDVQHDWAETNFFSIYIPEPNITAWVYTVARAGVGAMAVDVSAINGIGYLNTDAIYVDFQQHLPLPPKLENYTLPNGLSIKTSNEPRDYHIHYIGVDNTEFDWHVKGIMEPFDIHDPAMDPMASGDPHNTGFGAAYANHFDMTTHVTGTAKIRGRRFDVDCVTIMDHSWGPRNERGMKNMGWMNACFGDDYSVQVIFSFDPYAKGWDAFQLAHGYALVDGKVRGLTAGKGRAISRKGQFPLGYELVVTDIDGREHRLIGTAVAQHPWSCYSNTQAKLTVMEWHTNGRVGYGQAQENWPLDRHAGEDFKAGR